MSALTISVYSLVLLVLVTTTFDASTLAMQIQFSSKSATLEAEITAYPSTVMILYYYKETYELVCTGHLITLQWVLTAAQCFHYLNEHFLKVCAGYKAMTDILDTKPDATNCKEAWNKKPFPKYECCSHDEDDIALIGLREAFKKTDKVQPIPLAVSPLEPDRFHECYVVGYCRGHQTYRSYYNCSYYGHSGDYCFKIGDTLYTFENTQLRSRPVSVSRKCLCNLKMPWWETSKKVRAPFMCYNERERPMSNRQFCQGDVGAALVCKEQLYGILTSTLAASFYTSCLKKSSVGLNGTYFGDKVEQMTIAFANPCTHIRWINEWAKLHSPQEIKRGGCEKEEDLFKKERDKIKDPEVEYWEYKNQEPPKQRRMKKKNTKTKKKKGEEEGKEKEEEEEEDGEEGEEGEDEYSNVAIKRVSRNMLLISATILILTLLR